MHKYIAVLATFTLFSNVLFAESKQDMTDPMSVYTGGEVIAGNQGLGATFQFGINKGDWGLLGKIEGKDNFDSYRTRFFTPNKKTGTGLFKSWGRKI